MRGGPELVWLGEDTRFVCDFLASCGHGASLGEAAADWDAQGIAGVVVCLLEGAEGSGGGEASGEEKGWDWGWRHGGLRMSLEVTLVVGWRLDGLLRCSVCSLSRTGIFYIT